MGHAFGIRPRVKTVCETVHHPTKQKRQRYECRFKWFHAASLCHQMMVQPIGSATGGA